MGDGKGGKGKGKGKKGKGKGKKGKGGDAEGEGEEGEEEGEGEGEGSMVPDSDNDGKKCQYKPGSLRTFKITGGKANEETCTKACAENPACVAYSAQFGKWCIGCKEALLDKHEGAKAFTNR